MSVVTSVNGKTGPAVILNASEIKAGPSGTKTIEQSIQQQSYRATPTKIDGTTDDYLLTITKGA